MYCMCSIVFFSEMVCLMATFNASQARELVLNSVREKGMSEDISDQYILIFELPTGIPWTYLHIVRHTWLSLKMFS